MMKTNLILATFGVVLSSMSSVEPKKSIFDFSKSYNKETTCETEAGYSDVTADLFSMQFDLTSLQGNEAMSMNQVINDTSKTLDTFIYCFSYNSFVPKNAFISTSKEREDEMNYKESFDEYDLRIVSKTHDGCLTKCLVEGLTNLSEEDRRYNVSMVQMKNPRDITSISFGMEFYFHTNEKNVVEGAFQIKEVVTITSGVIKDCFYSKGETKYKGETGLEKHIYEDHFYYFFNTDWKIDELMEVDVQFYNFNYFIPAWYRKFGYAYSYAEYQKDCDKYVNDYWADHYEYDLTSNYRLCEDVPLLEVDRNLARQNSTIGSTGGFTKKYVTTGLYKHTKTVTPGKEKIEFDTTEWKWFVPYRVKKYANLDNLIDLRNYQYKENDAFNFTEMKKQYEFGIHFAQTERIYYGGKHSDLDVTTWGKHPFGILTGEGVESTCITRLKFVKDGKVYNLGAVDIPKETDPEPIMPVNPGTPIKEPNWWEIILAVVLGVTGVYIVYQLVSPLFKKKGKKKNA